MRSGCKDHSYRFEHTAQITPGDSVPTLLGVCAKVLKRFAINNVTVKLEKCYIACPETEYVGHILEAGQGVRVDPRKVEKMRSMGVPRDVSELKTFIGMAAYYRRFIKDFAHIVMPLRKIENVFKSNQQPIADLWGQNQMKAFNAIKAAMSEAPILTFPDFEKPFIVMPDCSNMAMGACLMQIKDGVERPIAYDSKVLNKHEEGYGISDKEGAAAIWAVRKWRPYLQGSQVILITDHASLKSLTGHKEQKSVRQARYAMDLSEYAITIIHRA